MKHHLKSFARRNFGQQLCLWCGGAAYSGDCLATADLRAFVADFANEHGKQWKSKIRKAWEAPENASDTMLRRCRNIISPSGLTKITPIMLSVVLRK